MEDTIERVGFRHYELHETYEADIASGAATANDICFVKETGKIHTQDGEYGGGDIYEWTLPEDATVTETEIGADYTGSITQEELDAMINAKVLICNDGETGRFLFTDSQVSENTETGAKEYFGTTRTAIGFPFIDGAIVFSANDADLTFRLEMIIGNRADSEMSDTSYNPIANAVVKQYIDNAVSGASVTIDSEMSDSSANAVQNKVIKAYVDNAVANVDIDVDSAMSDSSTNPVQNKVVKAELDKKVDVVSGKQLSTEDFTSALKTKLEGLSNYDDTEISNAVDGLQTQIDTLVSGDASTAIESFNEIVAFLSGLDDTESLESIIASIEQQIAGKQDLLVSGTNIKTINGESILGEGDIELDLSAYATKDEVIENEEVTAAAINDLKDRLGDFSSDMLDDYATKEELNTEIAELTEEVVLNEEITAAAINDLNDRVSSCATLSDLDSKQDILVSGSTIKTVNGNSLLGSGDITIEGGGGSGVQMLEVRYYWDGTELTDDDKAINAATYAALASGGEYVLYNDLMGMRVNVTCIELPSEDNPAFAVVLETSLLGLVNYSTKMLAIDMTGSIVNSMTIPDMPYPYLDLSNVTDYASLIQAFANIGLINLFDDTSYDSIGVLALAGKPMGGVKSESCICLFAGASGGYTNSIAIEYLNEASETHLIVATESGGTANFRHTILNGATLTINPADNSTVLDNNKLIVSDTTNIRIVKDSKVYSPIIQDGLNFTIYTGSAYETWQLNSDGTTTQIS